MLEHILSHDECDVDPVNRLEHATPLHLALQLEDPELRKHVVESLLDAGADTRYFAPFASDWLDLLMPRVLELKTRTEIHHSTWFSLKTKRSSR